MITIVKHVTTIENIYTYFEFDGCDGWENFDKLLSVLVDQLGCEIEKQLDGIWSRHYDIKKDGFAFHFLYHEDFGNFLCSLEKKDDAYYNKLECIAKEVAEKYSLSLKD